MTEPLPFATPEDWWNWLATHHATETEIWLLYHKKGSGLPSIDWQQAVAEAEAIAWGWIDGIRKSVNETSWQQRFTPRKPGSSWSKINIAHAERLIATGRMQPSGQRHIDIAKQNGTWDAAYSGGKGAEHARKGQRRAASSCPCSSHDIAHEQKQRQRQAAHKVARSGGHGRAVAAAQQCIDGP